MIESLRVSGTQKLLLFTLIFFISTSLSILLDIPFLRQVLGFVFFTFVPGFLALYILKLDKLGLTEKTILSVGISISFLMFAGLLINFVYPWFGYDTPLSTNSLLITFGVILLVFAIIAYLRNRTTSFVNLSDFKLDTREKAFLLLPALFPLLSIIGISVMNAVDNNVTLMILLFLIPAYTIFIAIKHNQIPDRVYPPMIFFFSISLVLIFALRSHHIIGIDAHAEYNIFQQTFQNSQWQLFTNSTLDAAISISILPTIYQSLLSVDSENLFKVLYPLLFSVSPLVIYIISRRYVGNFYGFLASLFFMSQSVFLKTAFHPRTTVAILFFALVVMVLSHSKLRKFDKRLLFIVFSAATIFSHYSTATILLIVVLLVALSMWVASQIITSRRKLVLRVNPSGGSDFSNTEGKLPFKNQVAPIGVFLSQLKGHITFGFVILYFTVLYLWYSQVTEVAFQGIVIFVSQTASKIGEFFILESRGSTVTSAFGVGLESKGIPHQIDFIFSWMAITFIGIGLLATLVQFRHSIDLPDEWKKETWKYLLSPRLDVGFFSLSLACSVTLITAVALPYVFVGYALNRTWLQMMVVLSPFFIIGGVFVARIFRIRLAYLIILVSLIPLFMSSTGTVYQMFGVPRVITLNSEGQMYDMMFIHDQEISATAWLRDYAYEDVAIYADYLSHIRSPDRISMSYFGSLIEENKPIGKGYVYLRYTGAVNGKLLGRNQQWHDIAEYQDEFIARSLIYTNGGSEVWR